MLGIAPRALYTVGKCSTTKLIPTLDLFLKKAFRTILNINFSGNFMGFAGRRSGFKTSSTSNTLSLLPPHPPPPLSPDSHASQGRVKSSELRRYCGSKQPCPFPWAEKGVPFFHLPRGERQSARQVQRRPSPIAQHRPASPAPRSSPGNHFPARRELRKAPGSGPASAGPAGLQPMPHQSLAPGTAPPGKLFERVQNMPTPCRGRKRA